MKIKKDINQYSVSSSRYPGQQYPLIRNKGRMHFYGMTSDEIRLLGIAMKKIEGPGYGGEFDK